MRIDITGINKAQLLCAIQKRAYPSSEPISYQDALECFKESYDSETQTSYIDYVGDDEIAMTFHATELDMSTSSVAEEVVHEALESCRKVGPLPDPTTILEMVGTLLDTIHPMVDRSEKAGKEDVGMALTVALGILVRYSLSVPSMSKANPATASALINQFPGLPNTEHLIQGISVYLERADQFPPDLVDILEKILGSPLSGPTDPNSLN